jgi:hypothetical protein
MSGLMYQNAPHSVHSFILDKICYQE